jgi:hypothetical protein
MRALVLSALVASVSPVALLACDQDYASSTAARETFMGDTKEVPRSADAAAPAAPVMAPPQMGPLPPPVPHLGDASTDAPSDAVAAAVRAPAAPHPPAPAH